MRQDLLGLDAIADTVLNYRPKQKAKLSKSKIFTLELCAGGGGAALGLEQAGFIHTALIDNDKHSCATLRGNRPYWNVIEADICRLDVAYWRDGIDLLSGGLPCPPFSIAGKQLGADDDRDMFPSMFRIVKEVRPRAVMIENVRGILTARFNSFRAKIDKTFNIMGFDTYWTGFNAAEFGVPQTRFRAFLIALRRGVTKPLNWPIPMNENIITVGTAIGDLMSERGWHGATRWAKQANKVAPTVVGGSHKHGGPDLGPTRARREWAELGIDGLGLANEAPPPEFKGMPRLTIPMVARLQSFPDNWKFAGSKTNAYRQVGNALPVKLAYTVAKAVRECLV
jgi:DNA (cytosine-5)-methyltransferase 1